MSDGGRFKPGSVHLPAHTSPEGLTCGQDEYWGTMGGDGAGEGTGRSRN